MMKPIFIIGMPRSGTKLLRNILNRHPLVSIPSAETEFIPYFYRRRDDYGDLQKIENFHKFYRDFKATNFYYYMEDADFIWPPGKLYNRLASFSIEGIIKQILMMHAEYENKKIWGDKSPGYIYHTELIKQLYPDSIFIHIIRDVRDYCLSVRKAWNKNIYRAADKWCRAIDSIINKEDYDKDYFYEIRYENLIVNPMEEIESLCKWLGIDFYQNMLDLEKPVENLGSTKGNIEIVSDNYNKWKKELLPEEIEKIERIAGKTAARLGYPLITNSKAYSLNKREVIQFYVQDVLNLFAYRAKALNSKKAALFWMLRDLKKKLT